MRAPIPSNTGRRLGPAVVPVAVALTLAALAARPLIAAPPTREPAASTLLANRPETDLPKPVKETLSRESAGGKVVAIEIEQEGEDGTLIYEAEVVIGSHRYKIEITENGTLLEKEILHEEEDVSMKDLPAEVQATLRREVGGGEPKEIERHSVAGRTVYEAEAVIGARTYELLVAEDGTLLVKKLEHHEARDEDEYGEHDEHGERGEEEEAEECGAEEAKQGEAASATKVWSFDQAQAGSVPLGWKIDETSGTGTLARWQVVRDASAPSPPNAIAITKNENYGHTFNLLMAKSSSFRDLDIQVRVKALAGSEDQGGGPIWRAKDGDNYYISRWNPLEKNFRVYFVKNGRRRQLATAYIDTDTSVWHTIEIRHHGATITACFDGKKMMEVSDQTFTDAGMVGLWVKADGQTAFDDLTVRAETGGRVKHGVGRPR